MSPQTVTGHLTGCTLLSLAKISLAYNDKFEDNEVRDGSNIMIGSIDYEMKSLQKKCDTYFLTQGFDFVFWNRFIIIKHFNLPIEDVYILHR